MDLHKAILGEIRIDPFAVASARPGLCPYKLIIAINNYRNMKGHPACREANPLMVGVMLNDTELVKYLIEEGADVNKGRLVGSGPLCSALIKGHYEIASLLIKSGADVNSPNDKGETPMYYATNKDSPASIVQELIEHGVNADGSLIKREHECFSVTVYIERPIVRAIFNNNIPVVKLLLEQSIQVNYPLTSCSCNSSCKEVSPLTRAVISNSIESVKLLINYGANIDGQDGEYPTPLYASLYENDIAYLQVLISAGADVNKVHTMLDKVDQPILGTGEPDLTALHLAVVLEHYDAAKELLNAGADVNKSTLVTKRTALNFVCVLRYKEVASKIKMVKLLLDNGADLYTRDKYNCSPALNCLMRKRFDLIEEFLNAGMDVNADIGELGSLLMYSTANAVTNIVKLCLEHGANSTQRFKKCFNRCAYEGAITNGLHIAKLFFPYHPVDGISSCVIQTRKLRNLPTLKNQFKYFDGIKKNNEGAVKKALQNGAEPRAFLKDMRFPIFHTVASNNFAMLGTLLNRGVCPNVQNKKKETPLHIAAQSGFTKCCYDLLKHGACYNINSSAGQSPLKVSVSQDVIGLLKGIHLTFRKAKKGDLNSIKQTFNRMPDADFFSYNNCVNRKGNTLMQEAILSGSFQVAEAIMALRLNRAN